jgi:sugar-specific transcriptional regulator TrmB
MLDQLLQDYGLSKTEALSYLSVIELGSAPVSSIARRNGENRVTVYSALKSLVKK